MKTCVTSTLGLEFQSFVQKLYPMLEKSVNENFSDLIIETWICIMFTSLGDKMPNSSNTTLYLCKETTNSLLLFLYKIEQKVQVIEFMKYDSNQSKFHKKTSLCQL